MSKKTVCCHTRSIKKHWLNIFSMKNILIVYPNENILEIRTSYRRKHFDVSVINFFDCLRAEKNENLFFLKADTRALRESALERFDHLPLDMIVSYPAFSTVENYAKERGILFYAFDHFAQGSTYLDRFWLFNRQTAREFESVDHENTLQQDRLSPLENEFSFYSRFLPLRHNRVGVFYRKNRPLCLALIDDSFLVKDAHVLAVQIKTTFKEIQHRFGEKTNLVLFGRLRKFMDELAVRLQRVKLLAVHVIHDTSGFSAGSVYSMIHKSDFIFSCGNSLGVDAVVLKRPVIFIGMDNFLCHQLNNMVSQLPDSGSWQSLCRKQHEFLNRFVTFLEDKRLLIPNEAFSAKEFHDCLSSVVVGKEEDNSAMIAGAQCISCTGITQKEAIVAPYPGNAFDALGQNAPQTFIGGLKFRLLRFISFCFEGTK